jgi:hypothetical protein
MAAALGGWGRIGQGTKIMFSGPPLTYFLQLAQPYTFHHLPK